MDKILPKSREHLGTSTLAKQCSYRTTDVRNFCAEFDNAHGKALHIYMQITKTKPNFVDVYALKSVFVSEREIASKTGKVLDLTRKWKPFYTL